MTSPPDRPVCGNTIGDWLIVGDFGDGLSGSVYRVRHLRRPGLSGVLKLHRVWENGVSEKSFLAERTLAEQPPLPERMAKWLVSDSWQGHPYFVTTYLDPTPKGLSDREWMTYAFALIDLFAELNGNRLIYHRDVKPRNLRSRNGLPMLIDLGLAIPRDDDALYPLERVGSRDFIAPEILRGERYDVRSEIYSTAFSPSFRLPSSARSLPRCSTPPNRTVSSARPPGRSFATKPKRIGKPTSATARRASPSCQRAGRPQQSSSAHSPTITTTPARYRTSPTNIIGRNRSRSTDLTRTTTIKWTRPSST